MQETGLEMLSHSVVIGIIAYAFMIYALKQDQPTAENRSLLFAALVLIYMLLFGHELPKFPIKI